MTDFIHEHPKDEPIPAPAQPAEEEIPLDEKTGQKRVYGYIFILFVVAFSLLLWAFLMNQRSNDQVLSELRGSTSTLQSTLDRNIQLERQVEALERQIEAAEGDKAALQRELDEAKREYELAAARTQDARDELDAARTVYYAALKANEGDDAAAAAVLADWDTAFLLECIEREDSKLVQDSEPDPVRPRYDALVESLSELGYLTTAEDGQLTLTKATD